MATSGNPANSGLISNEALKFIDDNMAEDLAPRTSGNIEQLRKDIFDGFAPAAKRAIERNEVSIEEKAQAGVPYLDVLPSNCRDDRLIFYCFGGGFVTGSPYEDLPVSAALAKHTGARVVSLNYPMSPEHPWPAALNAAHSLYSAITAELTNARIALVGESAGGNLALALTQYLRSNGSSLPDVMALLSPWCDLTNQGDSLEFNRDRDPTLRFDPDMYASNAYAGDIPLDDPGVSPVFGKFDDGFPPAIITTGTRDLLMSNATRLSRVMREAGIKVDLRVWEGLWHVFEFYDEIPESHLSLAEIGAFLNTHFDKS